MSENINGFTTYRVVISRQGKVKYKLTRKKHYLWNNDDMVYYNDDTDEDYYMEIPKNGRKLFSLSESGKERLLVKLDKN